MKTGSAILAGMAMMFLVTQVCADEVAGTIKSVKGEVAVNRGAASLRAFAGMPLQAADRITTGADSAVGVTLQDGTLLSFGAKSVSQLSEFRYDPVSRDGNMLVSIFKGSMRFVTGLLGKQNSSAVKIRTPTATVGIRGTDFIVAVEGGE